MTAQPLTPDRPVNQVNNALDAVNKALNRTIAPGLNPKPNAIKSWTKKFVVRSPSAALCLHAALHLSTPVQEGLASHACRPFYC